MPAGSASATSRLRKSSRTSASWRMCSAMSGCTLSPPRAVIERATMLLSLHDHFLVSCEVNCETRKIKLYAKRDPRTPAPRGEQTIRVVVFNGVEGYQFENDPFGNIIVSSQAIPA